VLKESIFKSSGVERFQWHLPSRECLHLGPVDVQSQSSLDQIALTNFSHLVVNLVNRALDPIGHLRLHEACRTNLIRRGWVTAGGSLRMTVPGIHNLNLRKSVFTTLTWHVVNLVRRKGAWMLESCLRL
jgi:hypothetical protein